MHGAQNNSTTKKPRAGSTQKSASTAKTKSSTHKKTAAGSKRSSSKAASKPGTSKSKTASKRGKGTHTKSAASWRSRQLAPTPERYKEIQSALVERGYLKKDANGVWDTDSTDALRRFQQDQNLEANGKLNSLSLIALGLGPKRSTPAPAAAPKPPAQQNTAPAPPPVNPPVTPSPAPETPAAPPAGPVTPTQP